MENVRGKIIDIFKELKPELDIEKSTDLIEGGLLDSFDVIEFVSEVGDVFDIDFPVEEIIPENFYSLDTIEKIIKKVMEE
ncbi:phosphopantetheine-binding protein [Butyrivibrio sp. LB2008]|uniref:phosphopantetheine-binding protein n=1 Tax=Butyrivibrio sp. LB2008 TaxID=1408305 RepID=UPI00047AFFAA|nr:phosphopantetheine-binding protein [Butyrivibrio sp. LB2008]